MGKRYGTAVREEVLGKIRNGQKVSVVAREHGINEMTVRNWLVRDTENGSAQVLEMSRLKREKDSLLRIIGQLTYESELSKKNQRREGR